MGNKTIRSGDATPHQLIIDYVFKITKGFVKLRHDDVSEIINMVLINGATAYVLLYRYNGNNNSWDKGKRIATSNEIIKRKIIEALESKPVEKCYRFECYNSDGELEGNIYTINPMLFE
jgi:hypothetical protein